MFLCDYNGSAARTGVYAFRFRPRGASFELDNLHKFLWGLSCSDVGFGPEGLYVADWAASWNPADKGRIYCVSNPDPAARAAAAGTQKLLARGMAERDSEQLAALLAYSDQRVRLAAQLALVENGEDGLAAMQRIAHDSDEPLARLHAIWGLGIAGRSRPARLEPLLPLLADADDEVRGQTAQIMGEARYTVAVENMLPLLSDNSSRVRMLAAIALGKLGDPRAREPLLALLRENADRDPYLRHGAVMGLSLLGDADAIAAHRHDPNPSVRLGVLLALRRMGDRRVADFLKDPSAQLVTEAARAINDLPIRASRPQLAALIAPYLQDEGQRPENLPLGEPLLRRILNANFREGGNQNARSLLQFLAQRANSDAMRREAAAALADWRQPGPLDRVVGLSRPLASRSGRLVVQLLEDSAVKLLRGGGPALREDLIRLLGLYEISTGNDVLAQWVTDSEQTSAIRVAAMQMLAHLEDGRTVGLLERAMKDRNPALRIAAGRLLAERDPERAAELLISVVDRSETKRERQQALAALATIFRPEVDASLARWLDELIEENFPKTLQLDLIEAATDRNDPEVIRKLENYQNSFSPLDPLAPYRAAIHGGNYERGRELFIGRMEVNCLRCHQVKTVGGTAGPALTRVGIEKTREQLLESIVLPNAKITKGYETTVITTDEGRLISGIVQSEDDQWVRLLTPERQLIDIAVHSIDDRFSGKSAMPEEMHKHLDKFDLRDLVEFLYQLGRRPQDR
jgi:quinoprotein glucose dehydrogenase